MPPVQDLIRDHRQHFLDRKLARSPLLHFSPGAHRIDICDFFKGIQANLPAANHGDHGVSSAQALLENLLGSHQNATIHGISPTLLKKLERIQKAAIDSQHSTGQHTLYLGYPCIVMPEEGGKKAKLAPVMLFTISIDLSQNPARLRIRRPEEGKAVLNRVLLAYTNRKYGTTLNSSKHLLDTEGAELTNKIAQIFASWHGLKNEFAYPSVAPVSASQLKLDPSESDPYIADHAILGLAEFSGQALLDDLDHIEAMFKEGAECPSALAKLIEPAEHGEANEAIEPANERRKWLVEKSDPSQEKAIWAQNANSLVVLQGPPGTGKSQTIVNIVADALAQKKTVMVVCQKRAAIEVVQKRLRAVGLGDLAVLIDDVDTDRQAVIQRIRAIEEEFNHDRLHPQNRERVSQTIQTVESRIDRVIDALNDRTDGTALPRRIRYGDLQAQLKKLGFLDPQAGWSPALISSIKEMLSTQDGLSLAELNDEIRRIQNVDRRVQALRYGENSWSDVSLQLRTDPDQLQEIRAATSGLSEVPSALPHDSSTAWIAEHPWASDGEALPISSLLASEIQHAEFGQFQAWLNRLRCIQAINPRLNTDSVTQSLRDNALDSSFLLSLEREIGELNDMLALKDDIREHAVLKLAEQVLGNARGDWAKHIRAIALQIWRRELKQRQAAGMNDAPRVSDLVAELKQAIQSKRALDSQDILTSYRERVDNRNRLQYRNLLRLKGNKKTGTTKTSLRDLYSGGKPEIRKISPLLLVSPETAASMLPLEAGLYDLVVIDEASQMFVAEAIPMLFRGKAALIAGDKQQMPPSNHFAFESTDDGDANQDEAEDGDEENVVPAPLIAAEGIYRLLDAADESLGAGSPNRLSLLVHYRSERKELIDFSNHAFYEGQLIIPAGNAPLLPFMRSAIEFEQVNGSFASGTNEKEAQRIVELLGHIWDCAQENRPSLGVIVSNTTQRDRILDLIQERSESDELFRDAYEAEGERIKEGEDISFFVRSVEHVQGDERDLIIFGLTYSGKSKRLGPLNTTDDGRKRLNVAVTRAKRGMIVLSSLNIDQISNPAQKGIKDIYYVWQYLRYARAVAHQSRQSINLILNQLNENRANIDAGETESPFEEDVKHFLESLGFQVDCQVGESGFRIDLGVRISADEPNYLCGIECDGARYHSSWRARTNDVWRQEILESKGWKIIRVWSTRWFDDPQRTSTQLAQQLEALREQIQAPNVSVNDFIHRVEAPDETAPEAIHTEPLAQEVIPPQIITAPENDFPIVCVGDTVRYRFIDDGREATVQIMLNGNAEAGTVSKGTPLAIALLEAGVGDEVLFQSPGGDKRLLILAINNITADLV